METNEYIIKSENLPNEFEGFRIAHVSDLHNDGCADELVCAVKNAEPDIIVMTGDTVHRERKFDNAKRFVRGIKNIAPVYFVTGNHEHAIKSYGEFAEFLRESGVEILENEFIAIERGGAQIALLGLNDPTFFEKGKTDYLVELDALCGKADELGKKYKVLLCHRPELFEKYAACGIDLSLCGHTHGGHVRFPLIGALYAPNQGFFPKYSDGKFIRDSSVMIISRGLGKSRAVPRVLNPSELIVEILSAGKEQETERPKGVKNKKLQKKQ